MEEVEAVVAAVTAAAATARVEEAALMAAAARAAAAEKAEAAPAGEGMVAAVMVVEGSVPQMVEVEARVTDTLVAAVMGEAAMVAAPTEMVAAAAVAAAARPAAVAVVAHTGPNRPQRADCVLRRCRFRCSRRDRLRQCIPYLAGRRIERPLTPGRRSDR